MTTIPRQQIVDGVDTCRRDMKGIRLCMRWHPSVSYQTSGKDFGLVGHVEVWYAAQLIDSLLGGTRVARCCFGKNEFRGEKFILGFLLLPPLGRDLLSGRNAQVATRQGHQVTYHRGFYIH